MRRVARMNRQGLWRNETHSLEDFAALQRRQLDEACQGLLGQINVLNVEQLEERRDEHGVRQTKRTTQTEMSRPPWHRGWAHRWRRQVQRPARPPTCESGSGTQGWPAKKKQIHRGGSSLAKNECMQRQHPTCWGWASASKMLVSTGTKASGLKPCSVSSVPISSVCRGGGGE